MLKRWKEEEQAQREGIRKIRCTDSERDHWQASKLILVRRRDQDEFAQPDDLEVVVDHRKWGKLNLTEQAKFAEWATVCELDAGLLTIFVNTKSSVVGTWEQKSGFSGAGPSDVVAPSVEAPEGF